MNIEVKVGDVWTRKELDNLYIDSKNSGYLSEWSFGFTIDGDNYEKFIINSIPYEFWKINENDEFQCTKVGSEYLEQPKDTFVNLGFKSMNDRDHKNYYTRWTNGKKDKWNPLTNNAFTGNKNLEY